MSSYITMRHYSGFPLHIAVLYCCVLKQPAQNSVVPKRLIFTVDTFNIMSRAGSRMFYITMLLTVSSTNICRRGGDGRDKAYTCLILVAECGRQLPKSRSQLTVLVSNLHIYNCTCPAITQTGPHAQPSTYWPCTFLHYIILIGQNSSSKADNDIRTQIQVEFV